nr:hypothetical protein [Tanacetum cinerariifolium]
MLAKNDKLMGLNEFVADTEEDIDMKEVIGRSIDKDYRLGKAINIAVMELDNLVNRRALFIEELDSLGVRHVPIKFAKFLKETQAKERKTVANFQILVREMELNASVNAFELTEQAESTYLKDKMKFWLTRACTEDQTFAMLMRDVCLELKIKMHKTRRLIVELDALREVRDAVMSLNHMREIICRESAKPAVLEQLSASTDVAMRLKDGY